ncbi:DNA adenine methylase [Nocardioides ochotonae]|uniref:DNA adenine methylase n=1 Tax=Nocardioides ochotonae TaxID=2685869 RepID=UPI00174AAB2A|nr:DNA adenine methylase [Nocardioides ochotonae]
MRYQGGKHRLAKELGRIIIERAAGRSTYVEPFVGGASVLAQVAPHFRRVVAADAQEDLILMWRAVQDGWIPPTTMPSVEDYWAMRDDPTPSPLRAFTGFGCSFGGGWFAGYARSNTLREDFAMAAHRGILRKAANFPHAEFRHCDYRLLGDVIGPDAVVYCDPPYAGTRTYKGTPSAGFDHDMFWRVAARWSEAGAVVLVSEYAAPDHWVPIWSKTRHVDFCLDNKGHKAVERLYVHPAHLTAADREAA